MSNFLTMQDYIDLSNIQQRGATDEEQQSFLLSRFYKISENEIRKKDMKEISYLSIDFIKYLEEINIESLSLSIENIKEESEKIQNRAEILDIRE